MPALYNIKSNKDDVLLRACFVGLLYELSNTIGWSMETSDGAVEIDVPFYFSIAGSERFFQDNILFDEHKDPGDLIAEAGQEKIPRGVINFDGLTMEPDTSVNPFEYGKYVRQEIGPSGQVTLETYAAEIFHINVVIDYEVVIFVDSVIDVLKCTEAVINGMYKERGFSIDYDNIRIPCSLVVPDTYTHDRDLDYGFDVDKKAYRLQVPMKLTCRYPIRKLETEIHASNSMHDIQYSKVLGVTGGGVTPGVGGTGSSYTKKVTDIDTQGQVIPGAGKGGPAWPITTETTYPPVDPS